MNKLKPTKFKDDDVYILVSIDLIYEHNGVSLDYVQVIDQYVEK